MKKFDKLKQDFIEILKDKSPCAGEYRKVLSSENEQQLLDVIKNNLDWCISAKAISNDFLTKFTATRATGTRATATRATGTRAPSVQIQILN